MRLGRALVIVFVTGLWIACDKETPVAPMEEEGAAGPPRMRAMPNPPGPPNHPQFVTSVNGLTGDVELAAGDNVTLTESDNTITIAATTASGPQVIYGYAYRIGEGYWQVSPPTVDVGRVVEDIFLMKGPYGNPFDEAYLVVTPVNVIAVSCTVSQAFLAYFYVDCRDKDGTRVYPNFFFVLVGVYS